MLCAQFSRVRRRLGGTFRMDVLATMSKNTQSIQMPSLVSNNDSRNNSWRPHSLLLRVGRFHMTGRPLVMVGTSSAHSMLPRPPAFEATLLGRYVHKRWMSSNNKNTIKGDSSADKTTKSEQPAVTQESPESGRLSSIVRSVRPALWKVKDASVGDLVSVYAIVILIALIIFSPYAIAQMKKAESEYIELDEYDPVAQMEKIVRYDLFGEEALHEAYKKEAAREHHDPAHRKSIDNTIDMATDVLQSNALQEAIASLITRVLESVQFQRACQTLLRNLWNDLVNDPETTAQIVQLLNNAIQNKEIQRSTRLLVLQLIKDREVYDELTRLLVRLGQEQEVLDATRALLTESAHNALNDPEILDHSMEFATDVVGDDIVQRTSGEALRNTVTYAAGPGVSAFLAIVGIGLVWFAISAFGKSRASEQEAAMVDKAVASIARSMQSGAGDGVAALASLPARLLSLLASILMFPFRLAEKGFSGLERTGENIISAVTSAIHAIVALPGVILRATMTQLVRAGRSISERTFDTISRIGAAISASFIGPILQSVATATSSAFSTLARITEPACHFVATCMNDVGESLSKVPSLMTNALSASGTCINAVVAVGGRIAGNATFRLRGLCLHCGTIVKTCVMTLAAKSIHSQTVTMEIIKSCVAVLREKSSRAQAVTSEFMTRLGAQCGSLTQSLIQRSAEVEQVTLKIAKDVGASIGAAGSRVSSALAAVASWCSNLFRRNDKGDSTASSTI